ncbi:T9SS type A sorting domain-containing protein [bacterium]|nr:T9SS type A sorting domain-containing protein [bacterium]
MKTLNTILCGLSLLLATSLFAQDDWTMQSPATKPSGRFGHTMVSLGGDQALLFGGYDNSFLYDDTWVFDLSDNTWTLKSPATQPSARSVYAMASLGGDKALLFGGFDSFSSSDETWVYDLSDNTWTLQSPATKPSARALLAMAPIDGGKVLLFGGFEDIGPDDETWVYDLSDNTWTLKSPTTKPSARFFHSMASLGGDQVLLFGGYDGAYNDETWIYDLSDNTWTLQSPATKPSARQAYGMASLSGDQVLLFGGDDNFNDDETWIYDLSDNTWTLQSPATKPSARFDPAMAFLGGDQVLLFGGIDDNYDDETWVYDLSDNSWTLKAMQPSARYDHGMASLGGDQVLLFGGFDGSPVGPDGETWVYDLSDNTWTLQSPATQPSARGNHAMASLGGDQVLLFGGGDDETWVYDLSDNTWTLKSPATKPSVRAFGHRMASLGGDQVLLFGGYDYDAGGYDDETWVYDLSDNIWTLKSPAAKPSARVWHGMASLGSDQVLLFGGYPSFPDDETWVYDLSDNTSTLKSPATRPSARFQHGMASLGGGQVLLFGGDTASGIDDETWVYAATPEVKPFVFLANKITLERTKQHTPAGDMHSNGTLTVSKGDPSTYNSNLTAVGKITINKENTINGNVKAPSISNSGTINGTKTIEAVTAEPLPSLSYGTISGPNKTVAKGKSLTLAPDDYGIVTVNSGSTLKLSSGEYFMKELRGSSSGIVIEIDLSSGDPVTINIQSNLQLGKEAEVRLLPNGETDSELVTFNTLQTSSVSFGKEAYLLGSFNAPNAKVTLVKNTQLRGAICAKEIYVERDCLFLHHESLGSLPGPGDLPKSAFDEDEEVTSTQQPVTSYELSQNYPNPFNPTTTISFALPEAGEVSLAIYNTNGQLVKKLVAGEMGPGRHNLVWDATDARGTRVASGVYLYILKAGEFTAQKKLVLMK